METMEKVVYLANAATTACATEVQAVMTQALSGACGNPSSHYSVGYEAKEFVDTGRAQVAKAINASPAEIFFTGCGSEADNWAVKGTAFTKARQNKKHLITSAFEHHAIMHSMAALERLGFEVTYIKPTTEGYIRRNGEVAALLELASGFDGELTVRENAYLRGAMLGYSRKFMDETYDSIIEFAELKSFEDRPFRQLSSGMKSRLAFSIASLVQPDILILDEVLSVGDGAFRKKSEAKMREIIHGGAATILVSHSLSQVREMCSKVLWLHRGRQIDFGDTAPICDRYQAYLEGELTL